MTTRAQDATGCSQNTRQVERCCLAEHVMRQTQAGATNQLSLPRKLVSSQLCFRTFHFQVSCQTTRNSESLEITFRTRSCLIAFPCVRSRHYSMVCDVFELSSLQTKLAFLQFLLSGRQQDSSFSMNLSIISQTQFTTLRLWPSLDT